MSPGGVRQNRGLLGRLRGWVRKVLRLLGWIVAGFWLGLVVSVSLAVAALVQAESWCGGSGTCSTLVKGVAIGTLIGNAFGLALLVTITSYWFRIHLLGRSVDRVLGAAETTES